MHVLNTHANSCPPVCSQRHSCSHKLPASIHQSRAPRRVSTMPVPLMQTASVRLLQILWHA